MEKWSAPVSHGVSECVMEKWSVLRAVPSARLPPPPGAQGGGGTERGGDSGGNGGNGIGTSYSAQSVGYGVAALYGGEFGGGSASVASARRLALAGLGDPSGGRGEGFVYTLVSTDMSDRTSKQASRQLALTGTAGGNSDLRKLKKAELDAALLKVGRDDVCVFTARR